MTGHITLGTRVYCGATVAANDFTFSDARRAVLFYDKRTNPTTCITACPVCCDKAREALGDTIMQGVQR